MSIEWKEEKRKLKDLKPYKRNPRTISRESYDSLVEDILKSGYHDRIKITIDNVIISGHQRRRALQDVRIGYKPSDEVSVLVAPRKLTDEEFKAEMIKANTHRGDWDFEILGNDFDAQDLVSYGLSESLIGILDCEEGEPELELKPKRKPKLCPECGAEV